VDVVEVQIAVAIADPPLHDALTKERILNHIKLIREMTDGFERNRRDGFPNERLDLCEIFVGADLKLLWRSPLRDLRTRHFRFIKPVQTRDHPIDFLFADHILR
jgi:hypothetical protein